MFVLHLCFLADPPSPHCRRRRVARHSPAPRALAASAAARASGLFRPLPRRPVRRASRLARAPFRTRTHTRHAGTWVCMPRCKQYIACNHSSAMCESRFILLSQESIRTYYLNTYLLRLIFLCHLTLASVGGGAGLVRIISSIICIVAIISECDWRRRRATDRFARARSVSLRIRYARVGAPGMAAAAENRNTKQKSRQWAFLCGIFSNCVNVFKVREVTNVVTLINPGARSSDWQAVVIERDVARSLFEDDSSSSSSSSSSAAAASDRETTTPAVARAVNEAIALTGRILLHRVFEGILRQLRVRVE